MTTIGRPPSIDTWRRRLAAAREELRFALYYPHPYPGRQKQRLATLEHRIHVLAAKVADLEQKDEGPSPLAPISKLL